MQNLSHDAFCPEVLEYKNLMHKLVHEKAGIQDCEVEQKIRDAKELCKHLFSIDGSDEFVEKFNLQMEKICQLKPGRKLIKYLSKYFNENDKVVVKSHVNTSAHGNKIFLDSAAENHTYTAWFDGFCVNSEKPFFVAIAHELIHVLHCKINPALQVLKGRIKTCSTFLQDMDDVEEQDTIIGLINNPEYFSSKAILCRNEKVRQKKCIDVICENAFLLALNLPPRVNHRSANLNFKFIDSGNWGDMQKANNSNGYYHWLDNMMVAASNYFSYEEPKLCENEEAALKCIEYEKIYPGFLISRVSQRLLTDVGFLVKVRNQIPDFFKRVLSFPHQITNMELMKRLGRERFDDFFMAHPFLWKEKEFVIHVLNCCKDQKSVKLAMEKMDQTLKNDPEILSLAESLSSQMSSKD